MHRAIHRRRGVSTLWVILALPVLLTLFVLVTDAANIWIARTELENGLEAAALAAVKEWSGGGSTMVPRNVGVQYAAANTVLGTPITITTNYNPANLPNENDSCAGNLVFGAITTPAPPHTFNAGVPAGCVPATVFIDATKADSGADTDARVFGIFYDGGPPYLSIRSVSFTIPVFPVNPSQQPYWDGSGAAGKVPIVSDQTVPIDALNRFNPAALDYRGLDPDPVSGTTNWICPAPPPPVINPNGDICFEFSNLVPFGTDRYRTLTIWFKDGAFTSTNDPMTTDFVRFGASFNQLNPPALPMGTMNNGDAIGIAGVSVTVTFYNNITMATPSVTQPFVNVPAPGRSEVNIMGAGGGNPAVKGQATVQIESFWKTFLCIPFGPYNVSACTYAMHDCDASRPRLVRIENFICPGP